ncbi:c-type cytochrome biogenesis protein CcmI, partial [Mitsuaria sp. GD03876]|nr:c-type cytochrome biogenesis protein CcmI [Mitsuaria sp. GD03876]
MNALFPLWASATGMLLAVLAVLLWPLLRESGSSTGMAARTAGGRWSRLGVAGVLSLGLPVAALAVYLEVGDPRAAAEETSGGGASHATEGVDVDAMVDRLAAKLAASPQDLQGWMVLARSREVQERYGDAVDAYRRAIALASGADQTQLRAKLQADLADAVGSQQGGDLGGPAQAAIDAALALDPDQPKALALAGAAAVRRGDTASARRHWTRLLGLL